MRISVAHRRSVTDHPSYLNGEENAKNVTPLAQSDIGHIQSSIRFLHPDQQHLPDKTLGPTD